MPDDAGRADPDPLSLRPSNIKEARRFIEKYHSHIPRLTGGLFAIGVESGGQLAGVAVIGRPVARKLAEDRRCLELTRTCTDGTKNVSSMLAAAAWRAVRAMGGERLVTYTLPGEAGTTYKAAGFRRIGPATKRKGEGWSSRPGRDQANAAEIVQTQKIRWEARARWDS